MTEKDQRKLYCYVDESGQDKEGRFFAVSILITEGQRTDLLTQLEQFEKTSGKGTKKWKKARPQFRKAYIEGIAGLEGLQGSVFVATYRNGKEYLAYTADAIGKVLRQCSGDKAIIYVDALREKERNRLKAQLNPSVDMPTQVRGVKRDENNAFIRLVDAICGLVRDADEGAESAKDLVARLKRRGILEAV